MFSIKGTHGFAQAITHDLWLMNFQLSTISRTLIKCIVFETNAKEEKRKQKWEPLISQLTCCIHSSNCDVYVRITTKTLPDSDGKSEARTGRREKSGGPTGRTAGPDGRRKFRRKKCANLEAAGGGWGFQKFESLNWGRGSFIRLFVRLEREGVLKRKRGRRKNREKEVFEDFSARKLNGKCLSMIICCLKLK